MGNNFGRGRCVCFTITVGFGGAGRGGVVFCRAKDEEGAFVAGLGNRLRYFVRGLALATHGPGVGMMGALLAKICG